MINTRHVTNEITKRLAAFVGDGPSGLHEPSFTGNEKKYISEAIDSSFVSSAGEFIGKFESQLGVLLGNENVVAVSSGTAALHLSILAAGVLPGDEVLIPSLTFIATANAVRYCGALPVLLDADEHHLGISSEKLEEFLQNQTRHSNGNLINKITGAVIRAIVPMHTLGRIGDITKITALAEKYSLVVVEDAAESLGSTYFGQQSGTFGNFGIFSLNGNKTITSGGGGVVVCRTSQDASKIRFMSSTAKKIHPFEFHHDEIGFNYRMPNLNAALALAQLEDLEDKINRQRSLYSRYKSVFEDMDEVDVLGEPEGNYSNYWLQGLILRSDVLNIRDEVLTISNSLGISTRPFWKPIQDQRPFLNSLVLDEEVTRKLVARTICVPSSPALAADAIE